MLFDDTRSTWNAAPPLRPADLIIVAPSRRSEFMSHWDGGALGLFGRPHSECLAAVKRIQSQHQSSNGWNDIGYNALICVHARAIEGRGLNAIGAHCTSHNTSAFGWQFMVGKGESVSQAMFDRMAQAYSDCASLAGHQLLKLGHRDGFATQCPGDQVYAWVKAGMPASVAPTPLPKPPAPKPAPSGVDRRKTASLQTLLELPADGLWGPMTDARAEILRAVLHRGARDAYRVKTTQLVVDTTRDGLWGPITARAAVVWVKQLQRLLGGLVVDGIWGDRTDLAYARMRAANKGKY